MLKNLKRFTASLLISVLFFNSAVFAYEDVPHTSPYYYAVEYLRRNDVFPDKKYFRPDIKISRVEFIKYLVILNSPEFKPKSIKPNLPYSDTQNNAWYAPYISEAIEIGVLAGNEVKINPYGKLSVFEALELLFNSRTIPIPRKHIGFIPYSDVEKNQRVQALVMRSIELGIVVPDRPDYFGLYKRVTRIQAANMIYRMDLVDLRTKPTQSKLNYATDPSLKKLISAWELVSGNYVHKEDIDKAELTDNAIRALVETLNDPYSVYMDQVQNQSFSDELDGEIEGIGAYINLNDKGQVVIVAPIKDSPAFHAGIKSGDIIKKVDDFDAEGATVQETVSKIKGPKGTTVKLTLDRNGRIVVIEVVRDVIIITSIEYEVIGRGNIMHIKLLNFNRNAIVALGEAVEIIQNNPNIKGVVLDIRDNPGGLLDVAIGVLGFFLPRQTTVVHVRYNYFNYRQDTRRSGELTGYPLVVLVNKGSASASEIVAGALQDHDAAIIIGETTFGKGTVQEINYFGDSSSLKLTVAEWLTPDENSIQGKGISPDIDIQEATDQTDFPLNRAVDELNKKIR